MQVRAVVTHTTVSLPATKTLYPVILYPPVPAGAIQDREAEAFPALAATDKGADGEVPGTALAALLAVLVPAEFDAVTVKLYCTPLVSPAREHERAPAVVQSFDASCAVVTA